MRFVLTSILFFSSSLYSFETTLLLIRHGETDWNLVGRLQGLTDTSLNAKGLFQAKEMAVKLISNHSDIYAIYSSDLTRAYSTAYETAKLFHFPIYTHSSLREFNVGEAKGRTEDEVASLFGHEDLLVQKYPNNRERWNYTLVPGQEVINDRIQRVRKALIDISESHPNEKIAVFTHKGCITALMADIENTAHVGKIFIPNCAILELKYDSENKNSPFHIVNLD